MATLLLEGLVTETIMPDQSTHEYDQMLEHYLTSMTNTTFVEPGTQDHVDPKTGKRTKNKNRHRRNYTAMMEEEKKTK